MKSSSDTFLERECTTDLVVDELFFTYSHQVPCRTSYPLSRKEERSYTPVENKEGTNGREEVRVVRGEENCREGVRSGRVRDRSRL